MRVLTRTSSVTKKVVLKAIVNLTGDPPSIYVHGSVTVYRDDDVVEIARVETDEGDSSGLLLQVRVIEGRWPMKGVMREWVYREQGEHVQGYTHVTVRSVEGSLETVEVQMLGSRA